MGLWDRLDDVWDGVYEAGTEVLSIPVGLVVAPWKDGKEYDGFMSVIRHQLVGSGAQALGGLFSPDTGLGAAIGGLPEPVRRGGAAVINPVLDGLETVYREVISEPTSALMTAGSLASRPGAGWGELVEGDTWRQAYRIAQDRSPGQAIYLALTTRDILDEQEVLNTASTDAYFVTTGAIDAIFRFRADPTAVLGKAAAAGRNRYLGVVNEPSVYRSVVNLARESMGRGTVTGSMLQSLPAPVLLTRQEQIARMAKGRRWQRTVSTVDRIRQEIGDGADLTLGAMDPQAVRLADDAAAMAARREAATATNRLRNDLQARQRRALDQADNLANLMGRQDELISEAQDDAYQVTFGQTGDRLYHGTPNPMSGNMPATGPVAVSGMVGAEPADNLFGPGIYLTTSPRVADSYANGATVSMTDPQNRRIYGFDVPDIENLKKLDMDLPPTDEFRGIVEQVMRDLWMDRFGALDELAEKWERGDFGTAADLWSWTVRDAGWQVPGALTGSRATARAGSNRVAVELNMALYNAGFKALRYEGGIRIGGMGPHTAYVWLDPDALKPVQVRNAAGMTEVEVNPGERMFSELREVIAYRDLSDVIPDSPEKMQAVIAEVRARAGDEINPSLDAELDRLYAFAAEQKRLSDEGENMDWDAIDGEADGLRDLLVTEYPELVQPRSGPLMVEGRPMPFEDAGADTEALRLKKKVLQNIRQSQLIRAYRMNVAQGVDLVNPDIGRYQRWLIRTQDDVTVLRGDAAYNREQAAEYRQRVADGEEPDRADVLLRIAEDYEYRAGKDEAQAARLEAARADTEARMKAAWGMDPIAASAALRAMESRLREARAALAHYDDELAHHAREKGQILSPQTVRQYEDGRVLALAVIADIEADMPAARQAAASAPPRRGGPTVPPVEPPSRYADFSDANRKLMEVAGRLRDRLFPNTPDGDAMALLLAQASGPGEIDLLLRAFVGDQAAFNALRTANVALHSRLATLKFQTDVVDGIAGSLNAAMRNTEFHNFVPEMQVGIEAEVRQIEQALFGNELAQSLTGSLDRMVRADMVNGVRTRITGSEWYQTSHMGRAVSTLFNMNPPNILAVDGVNADAAFSRFIRQAGAGLNAGERIFTPAQMDELRGRFIAAGAAERLGLVAEVENRALAKLAEQAGLSDQDLRKVLAAATEGRGMATRLMRERAYDATRVADDGTEINNAWVTITDEDGMVHRFPRPMYLTQAANGVAVPNFRQIRKQFTRIAEFKRQNPGIGRAVELPGDMLDGLMSIWKPAVLLRPAWTIRVVLMDEQLRRLSKIGAMADFLEYMQTTGRGAQNLVYDYMRRSNMVRAANDEIARLAAGEGLDVTSQSVRDALRMTPDVQRAVRRAEKRALRRGAVSGALVGTAVAGPGVGTAAGAALGAGVMRALAAVDSAGFGDVVVNGYHLQAAFGEQFDNDNLHRALVSADDGMRNWLADSERGYLANYRATGDFATVTPSQPGYAAAWERAVNRQMGQDPMVRQLLEGRTPDEVVRWLQTTEGRRYTRQTDPLRYENSSLYDDTNLREWVDQVADQVDRYTLGGDEVIRQAALEQRATEAVLRERMKATKLPAPPVHGEVLAQTIGYSPIRRSIKDFVDRAFTALGSMPTDHLSRNPFFATVYKAEVVRRVRTLTEGNGLRLSQKDLTTIENAARRAALAQTRRMLYDMGERSEFAAMIRNLMPFFPATQEVLTRWAGIAVENPAYVARVGMAYSALGSALPVVEEGAAATEYPTTPIYTVRTEDGDTAIRFRIPSFARSLVNRGWLRSAVDSQGFVQFDRRSLNLVTGGGIGFGPYVQVVASEMVRQVPSIEDSMKFVLPFGPVQQIAPGVPSAVTAFLPASAQRVLSGGNEDSRAFASMRAQVLVTKLTQMAQGDLPPIDMDDPNARAAFIGEVDDEARKLFALRTVAALTSPVSLTFMSPYAPYIEQYQALRNADARTADEQFLRLYGEEFFALTQRFTRTVDGVPATIPGAETRDRYRDLVEANPDLGALIIGSEGGGEGVKFSRAMYDRQLREEVRAGDPRNQRMRLSADEILTGPQVRLGWTEYTRTMDLIDAARIERGLPNLQVAGAADLREAKRQAIFQIAERYPAWFQQFAVRDANAERRKIEGMRAIVNTDDSGLANRPDIVGLRDYLQLRDLFTEALRDRAVAGGSAVITAAGNQDLMAAWETAVGQLRANSLTFADLHSRWLDRDLPSVDEFEGVSAA